VFYNLAAGRQAAGGGGSGGGGGGGGRGGGGGGAGWEDASPTPAALSPADAAAEAAAAALGSGLPRRLIRMDSAAAEVAPPGGARGEAGGGGGGGSSWRNEDEAELVLRLLAALAAWRGTDARTGVRHRFTGSVGIITFYRAQLGLLRGMIEQRFVQKAAAPVPGTAGGAAAGGADGGPGAPPPLDGRAALPFTVDVNTVDGFQGQERDVVILSCVRTLPPGWAGGGGGGGGGGGNAVGFLDDPRRMNVALTRAKYGCWVVGNGPALETATHWRAFLAHARAVAATIDLPSPDVDVMAL
jgi:hypothetical protein